MHWGITEFGRLDSHANASEAERRYSDGSRSAHPAIFRAHRRGWRRTGLAAAAEPRVRTPRWGSARPTRVLAASVVMVAAAACGDAQPPDAEKSLVALADPHGSPVSLTVGTADELEAAMDGTLVLHDGCLALRREGDGELVELVWEDDARWDPASDTITYRGGQASDGDAVSLGGGQVPTTEYIHRPEGCENLRSSFKVDSLGGA